MNNIFRRKPVLQRAPRSTTVPATGGVRIGDMPDLGTVTDSASFVGELAGSGRFSALALRSYVGGGGSGAPGIPEAPTDGRIYGRQGASASWQGALPLSGGALTGPLSLAADPASPLQAVTKQYADAISGTGKVTLTQPANAATITIADQKTLTVNTTITLTGTDGTTHTFPATSQNIPGLAASQTFSGTNFFTGTTQVGNGTGAPLLFIAGAAGNNRGIALRTGASTRWQLNATNNAESGNNVGSNFTLSAYTDAGVFTGQLFTAVRASGPFGLGGPYMSGAAPRVVSSNQATICNGNVGDSINIDDRQPVYPLAANPITTTSGSASVTIAWAGANPIVLSLSSILIAGATAVGGLTISGWYIVRASDANGFTITAASNATSSATGGGSSVTVRPGFASSMVKNYYSVRDGSAGFHVGTTDMYNCDPDFLPLASEPGNSGFTQRWSFGCSPRDDTGTLGGGLCGEEWDFINRMHDWGYSPDLYRAPNPTIGLWYGPWPVVHGAFTGGGTATNWNTMFSIFSSDGNVGVYTGFSCQKNSLVGVARDPTGHGGVALDLFGAYTTPIANNVTTVSGSPTVTIYVGIGSPAVNFPGALAPHANGDTIYIPVAFTVRGVTFAPGSYTVANVNQGAGTFTITGVGNATSSGLVTGGTWFWDNLAPFAPMQIWGEWTHGIYTHPTLSKINDGLIVRTQPGVGVGWDDGIGIATINGAEVSPGNVDVVLTAAGTGSVRAASPLRLKSYTVATLPAASAAYEGAMAYVTDATAPTYNGALTGGGAVKVPVFCDGTAWRAH
jgi:hypothetical protein